MLSQSTRKTKWLRLAQDPSVAVLVFMAAPYKRITACGKDGIVDSSDGYKPEEIQTGRVGPHGGFWGSSPSPRNSSALIAKSIILLIASDLFK